MKKNLLITCLLAAVAAQAVEKANYDSYNGFASYSVPKLPEKETHPSLWFNTDNVAEMRSKKDASPQALAMWNKVQESKFMTMDFLPTPSVHDDKKTVHQYYGYMSQIAKYAGFMIWMAEDASEKQKWIDRTTAALERVYDGPVYMLDPKSKGGATDEIYLGTWLQNYAAAYDWVQPFLSAEQDAAIRKRLVKQSDWMGRNIYNWTPRPHNHLSKPAWGLGSAALALSSEKNAISWLGVALAAGNDNTRYFFSEDGIYREGSHYMIFSMVNFLPFMVHYNNVAGVNQFETFTPVMEWGVKVRNGKGWLPNIEDSFIRPFPAHMAASLYKNTKTDLHSTAPLSEVMMWAWNSTEMEPFDHYFVENGYNYTGATWDYTLTLDEYLTFDPTIPSVQPDRSPTVFLDGGQSMFRNTWDSGTPEGRFLLFQGVAESDNHQHADHLSIIIFAENQQMVCDAGYTRKSYSDKIRTDWYNQAAAHNVVTLNGEAPVDVAESVTPVSRHRIDTSFFDFEEKEAPYAAGGRLRRAVAFPGESYFVVADIVNSPRKATASALLHGGRATMAGEDNYRVWNYKDDIYGPAAHLHTWTYGSADDFHIENSMGEHTYLKNDYAVFPCIKATGSATDQVILQVLIPAAAGEEGPQVSSVKNGNQVWATVVDGDITDTYLLQPTSESAVLDGIETDATFVWVRKQAGKVIQFAVREATTLTVGGATLHASDEPRTEAVEL